MTKKVLISKWLEENPDKTKADIGRMVNRDRRQVGDAIKRGHLMITNSKGRFFIVPAMYSEAFD